MSETKQKTSSEDWPRKEVGLRILEGRKKHSWTQAQLAEQVELDQSTISRLEKGMVEAKPVWALRELARVLQSNLGLEELEDYAQNIKNLKSIESEPVFNEAALTRMIRSIVQKEVERALAQQAAKPYSQPPADVLLSEGWPLPSNYEVQIENWSVMSRAEQEFVLREKRYELLGSGYERRANKTEHQRVLGTNYAPETMP